MPLPPKVGDGSCGIGRVKVQGQGETHQGGKSNGHVAIAGKIAVNLNGVAVYSHQVHESGIQFRIVEDTVHKVHTNVVGDHHFFKQPIHDQEHSTSKLGGGELEGFVNLRNEVGGTHNRTRNKLGEEGHEKTEIKDALSRFQLTPINVDGITQRLEGVERNSYRQSNVEDKISSKSVVGKGRENVHCHQLGSKGGVDQINEVIRIFEEGE